MHVFKIRKKHFLIPSLLACLSFARAVGATIVNRTDELREEDIGTECGLFEVKQIGDE